MHPCTPVLNKACVCVCLCFCLAGGPLESFSMRYLQLVGTHEIDFKLKGLKRDITMLCECDCYLPWLTAVFLVLCLCLLVGFC